MRPKLPLRAAAALAASPIAILALLSALGLLPWPAMLAATLAMALLAYAAARLWARDVARVMWALHRTTPGGEALPDPGPPRLAATAHLAREADRLARTLADRAAEADRRLQAEQALVRRLPDPVIVLGPARDVLRSNAAAEQAFGGEMPAVLRHPLLRAAIERALAEGRPQQADLTLPVPIARELNAAILPLDPPLADGGRLLAVLSDRTRERAVERMRADFVANASHELRTPLTSLIGFIDTLRGPAADDPAAQSRFLGIMAEQAQRMNRLIDDLLSLSRIELTEHRPPEDEVDLPALVRRIADAMAPLAEAKRTTLQLDCQPLPPVRGDEDQLEQVLQNLLDNAVKYGRQGGTVRLDLGPAPPAPPLPPRPGVALSVADDGPGIARDHIPRLTERFYRADKHRSRAVGGTGLGLAIVKHIVNRHRGQLAIDSTEGHGTTVTIWLPAAPAP